MKNVLILAADAATERQLADDLASAPAQVLAATSCHQLVRDVVRHAPDAVVVIDPAPDEGFFVALQLLRETSPCALLVFTDDESEAAMGRALELGVGAWVVKGYGRERLGALLALAGLRHQRQLAMQADLARLQARLDERKWVDRAKGLLMRDNALSEEQAFQLLRTASMHTNLRVGEVSRGVIEAAQMAGAINRAGQLRMLSQRIVRTLAQQALDADVPGAAEQFTQSCERAEGIFKHLGTVPLGDALGMLRDEAFAAWTALHERVMQPQPPLAEADRLAEALLDTADRLTRVLDEASGRRSLHVVNVCGRQRMLAQRLAKQALLLAAGIDGVKPEHVAQTMQAFEAALAELERAPASGEGLRSGLATARAHWVRLCEGARGADTRPGRQTLARESEALLLSFEQLTERYERSTQVLIA